MDIFWSRKVQQKVVILRVPPYIKRKIKGIIILLLKQKMNISSHKGLKAEREEGPQFGKVKSEDL